MAQETVKSARMESAASRFFTINNGQTKSLVLCVFLPFYYLKLFPPTY